LNEKLDPFEKRLLIFLMMVCKVYCSVPTSHLVEDAKPKNLSGATSRHEEFEVNISATRRCHPNTPTSPGMARNAAQCEVTKLA